MDTMRYIRYYIFALLSFSLFSSGCQKDIDIFTPQTLSSDIDLGAVMSIDVLGRVVDEAGIPVSDAIVSGGGKTSRTDENGIFIIPAGEYREQGAFVKVEKSGYFQGSRMLHPENQTDAYVQIKLIKKNLSGSFSSFDGGTVTLNSGLSIEFTAGDLVMENGTVYQGEVKVFARFINPLSSNLPSEMPGNLWGIQENGEQVVLQTFGMAGIELEGSSGQMLQIKEGSSATLSFPIPAEMNAYAPAQIPLWYFDQSIGFWKEEGIAVKDQSFYKATVTHFSFWNCDAPFPLINFKVRFENSDGFGIPYHSVIIKRRNQTGVGIAVTDSTGFVSGKIPKNEELTLELWDKCQTLLYSKSIGPISADSDLGVLQVSLPSGTNILRIYGKLINCHSEPVKMGYVKISTPSMDQFIPVDSDGSFSKLILNCSSDELQLTAYDTESFRETIVYSFSSQLDIATGPIKVCNDLTDYMVLQAEGDSKLATQYSIEESGISNKLLLSAIFQEDTTQTDFISVHFNMPDSGVGSYNLSGVPFEITYKREQILSWDLKVTITKYGPVAGDRVMGTMSGSINILGKGEVPLILSFSALRQ